MLIALLGLISCDKAPPELLRVGTHVWTGYELLYLARERGYFAKTPIRLFELTSSTQSINAFRNHAIDIAALTLDEALLLVQDEFDVRILLVTDISNGGDALIARPEIKSLPAIKGRRIGVEHQALGAYMLSRALETSGLTPNDIKMIPLESGRHENAYVKGKVDAVVTFEPTVTHLLASGARKLFDSSQIPGEIVDVLVVHNEVYQQRKDDLRLLATGWFQALDDLHRNPQQTVTEMAPRIGLSEPEFLQALQALILPKREDNLNLLTGKQPTLLKTANQLAQIMLREGLLRKPVDPVSLFDANSAELLQ